jgi:hypothetical protein
MISTNDRCPVSNEAVQQAPPRVGDFAEIICPTCGRFRVSQSSLHQLAQMPTELSLNALSKAKKRAEIEGHEVPHIMSYDLVMS